MATKKLGLTRDQLAQFLTDFEQIRQFERLFSTVETLETADASEIEALAGSASARAVQALDTLARLQDTVDLLASAPPPKQPSRACYGSFYDTTTQQPAAINTAYAVTFNTTDLSFGVRRGATTSQIFVDDPGVYNIAFSAQLDNTSGGSHLIWIWIRINGVDVPNSASQVRLKGTDGELVAAWNFMADLKSGDYIQLMYSADDTSVQILAQAAVAPVPAIPSVILTVSNNIEGVKQ
jgi:hypothetical protein